MEMAAIAIAALFVIYTTIFRINTTTYLERKTYAYPDGTDNGNSDSYTAESLS